jgi:diadenosine tetraphosphate (Ap4A) HIT family hydrolase
MAADAAPALPGMCSLFMKRHAVDLHDLSPEEGAGFMTAAQSVSRFLAKSTGAVKINYEMHGNTIPHLHMHFFPRYRGDPFETGPIDPRVEGSPDDLQRHLTIRRRLIEALSRRPTI